MRLPLRKSERLKIHTDEGPLYLTPKGLEKLKHRLVDLEKSQMPQAIEDVKKTAEFGDFSENAEYQEAKHRLRRIHAQIFTIKEDLKRISLIEQNDRPRVQIGSTVVVETSGKQKTYQIVGPRETDPTRSRISHVSPLGKILMGKVIGDHITLITTDGEVVYKMIEIK